MADFWDYVDTDAAEFIDTADAEWIDPYAHKLAATLSFAGDCGRVQYLHRTVTGDI